MAIIVQDQTGLIVDANSYVSEADLVNYASLRGITLPDETQPLIIKSMDYLQALEFEGEPLDESQDTAFPTLADGIPKAVKKAQLILAIKAIDIDLMPTKQANTGTVLSERVEGAVAVTYSDPNQHNDASTMHRFPEVEALLKKYLKPVKFTVSRA